MPKASASAGLITATPALAGQRAACGAPHHRVDVPVDVAVDGVRAARGERPAHQGDQRAPGRTAGRAARAASWGCVVTSSSSMIRGLVRANSDRATTRAERRPAVTGSASVAGVTLGPPSFPCLRAVSVDAASAGVRPPTPPRPRRPRSDVRDRLGSRTDHRRGAPLRQRRRPPRWSPARSRSAVGMARAVCRVRGDRLGPGDRPVARHRVRPGEDEVEGDHHDDEEAQGQDQRHHGRAVVIANQRGWGNHFVHSILLRGAGDCVIATRSGPARWTSVAGVSAPGRGRRRRLLLMFTTGRAGRSR